MSIDSKEPKIEEPWRDFDPANSETHPTDGSKVFVETSKSKLKGPATFSTKTGFSLFNAPWGEHGEVKRWRYQNW